MRNRRILLGYLAVFFSVVYFYDSYRDNTLLVIMAVAVISLGGLVAWVWSVQPNKNDKE
jgi:membrane protein DedA with SNARE-associated domain